MSLKENHVPKRTVPMAIIVRIPAAMILKSIFGLSGVWMGFLLSHIVSVIFALIIFRLNSNENAIVDIKCSEA